MAVVTNRSSDHCGATADNLRQTGIACVVILCRGDEEEKEPLWEAQFTADATLPALELLIIVQWRAPPAGGSHHFNRQGSMASPWTTSRKPRPGELSI